MENTITSLVSPVFEELIHLIDSFHHDNFNARPASGGWTAAQVAEHIRLSAGSIAKVLTGTTISTDRDPEANVGTLRAIFMDFDSRMQSPDFILPADKPYQKADFIVFFRRLIKDIEDAVDELDLSETCLDFELPNMGRLTRIEWIAFVLYHTQRHIHQMRNISRKV